MLQLGLNWLYRADLGSFDYETQFPTHMHCSSKRNYYYRLYTTPLTWSTNSLRPGKFEVGKSMKREQFFTLPLCV